MKVFALAGLLLGLTACSWFGDESADPPAVLTEFPAEVAVRELWSGSTGKGPGPAYIRLQPNLQGDGLYVTDTRGRVRALAADTGEQRWRTDLDLEITAGVGVGDDLVLVASRKGVVVALDKASGMERWRAPASSEVLAMPVAEAGVVVVQSVDGRLTGLAAADGRRLWSLERSEPALSLRGTATPVIVSDVALTGFATGKLVAVSLREGRVLWDIPVAQSQGRSEIERLIDVDAPVMVVGKLLVAAAYQGKMVALNLDNGRLLWSRDLSVFTPMTTDGSNIYAVDTRGQVLALDLRSGATVWQQDKLHGRRPSAPVVVGQTVAVGDFEGYVHWLARDDGHFVARQRVSSAAVLAAPVADGGTLYVGAQDGDLAAYRLEPRAR
jgi:outer membrane protein assembly factor BamB